MNREAILQCKHCGTQRTAPGSGFTLEICPACDRRLSAQRFDRICPPLYRESDPKRLPHALHQVLAWKFGPIGLVIDGPTGTGKTRAMWLLLKQIMLAGHKVQAFGPTDFGHTLARKYREECAEDWLSDLAHADVVFFDDLGKLKLTERAEAELFGVIEARCANRVPILATTNDTGESLASRMTENRGAALVRRLREFCEIVHFT